MSSKKLFSLAESIINLAIDRNKSFTLAESCTGGLISSLLTDVPCSSKVFNGSFVSYSSQFKQSILGVDQEIIKIYGVVSEEVAMEMAKGAQKLTGSTVSISITGFAGPASENDDVGTAFIGSYNNGVLSSYTCRFEGSRIELKEHFAEKALDILLSLI